MLKLLEKINRIAHAHLYQITENKVKKHEKIVNKNYENEVNHCAKK